ncbi:hypothetical protein JAAARDRAFT_41796 [Jaapia argillacea MUCL 33604]|uniref:Uncharacterized protein n=1 Tax=Jaapia argillacea MUCL 33604 TaxID=933084 RepID=A0A067PA48_9AGAM|nr:hypothetical protein JAAARDRAFT_41796 [Jaapia argillacea MUCL 33604]
MKPPNPEDSEVLPSQVHPSYPYGNPTHIKHPAARPRLPHDRGSRAFFEDMAYAKAGVNGPLLWKDLALDVLLPTDQEKELQDRAKQARKMASGTTSQAPQGQQQQQGQGQGGAPGAGDQTIDEEDETDEDEDENDENENDDSSNEDDDEMDDDEEDDDDE